MAKCEVSVKTRYSSWFTFHVSYCEKDDGYDIEERGFLGGYSSVVSNANTISEGIRKAVWSKLNYDRNYSNDEVINFVGFLEKNKNGKWWEYNK